MPELTEPRGPRWIVWANPPGPPTFVVDEEHAVVVRPTIVFELFKGYPLTYYSVSPTDSRRSLYYRELYCPTKWERLLGV